MTLAQLAAVRRDLEPEVVELYQKARIDLSTLSPICAPEELAPAINVSVGSLAQDRYLKRGIPYIKLNRRVRYSRAEVARHLLTNLHSGD